MPRAVWLAMLLCLGCAGARPTTEPAPEAAVDAMLLPPVDGRVALWVNRPTNFAVIGVAAGHGAELLYEQTALEGIPRSGYVITPQGDGGYDRIYLIASRAPIDFSGSLGDMMHQASVVDAYAADTVRLDSLRCADGRLALVRRTIVTEQPKRTREEDERFADCYSREHFQHEHYAIEAGRQFFGVTLAKPAPFTPPTHKPPRYRPPRVVPNPGAHLDRNDERGLRWYAAKDQWHAITHNGEPGTELPRALGYVPYGGVWVPGRTGSSLLVTAHDAVRAIVNGSVGAVRSNSALVMEASGRIATAQVSVSGGYGAQGTAHVSYTIGGGGGGVSGYSGAGYSSGSGYHESASHASNSAPSYSAPSASSHESSVSVSPGSHH